MDMPESQEVIIGKLQVAVENLSQRESEHHAVVLAELRTIKEDIKPKLDEVYQMAFRKGDFTVFYEQLMKDTKRKEDEINENNKRKDDKIVEDNKLRDEKITKHEAWINKIIGGMILFNIVFIPVLVWLIIRILSK